MPVVARRILLSLAVALMPIAALADRGSVGLGWLTASSSVRVDTETEEQANTAALGAAFRAASLVRNPMRPASVRAALRDLIASVEAGRAGYDAIHLSAKSLPDRPPTSLTLAEVVDWVRATPGQQHAIGRYQFIPKTMAMLVNRLGLQPGDRFSPAVQDRMADELLADAGLAAFQAGTLDQSAFMHNVAAIWAGLPSASGKSVYHGTAGNRAGMSWQEYETRVGMIFAQ